MFVEFGGVGEFGTICLFVCVDPQVNNSLQELGLGGNGLRTSSLPTTTSFTSAN